MLGAVTVYRKLLSPSRVKVTVRPSTVTWDAARLERV